MCYSIYLSTESPTDLQALELEYARFEPNPVVPFPILQYAKQWFLTREFGDCSCHFRCLSTDEPCFGPSEDWFEADEDDVAATRQVFEVIRGIVEGGYGLDLMCIWEGTDIGSIRRREVKMNEVNETTFWFFENYYFSFRVDSG